MAFDFNWRREPTNPYLPADGSLAQMYANSMAGYKPLQLPVQKTSGQMAADAAQGMAGYTRNNMDNYRPNTIGNDMVRGQQPAPDMAGYGETLAAASQAAAAQKAKEERIAEIQNEISTIEKRIADNETKLKNWTGNADQIAAIEARKIYSQDPTSIWRWKTDKEEARRLANTEKNKAEDIAKANVQYEITNTLAAIRPNALMDSATQQRYLQQLADLKTMAQKNKISTDAIDTKIKEVLGETSDDTGKTKAELASIDWKGLKDKPGVTSSEVRDMIPNIIDPAEKKEAENFALELEKKEASAADNKAMKTWLTSMGVDYNTLDDDEKKSWKEMWKAQKGK